MKPRTLDELERTHTWQDIREAVGRACGFTDIRRWRRRIVGRHPVSERFCNLPSVPGHLYDEAIEAARLYANVHGHEFHIEYKHQRETWRVIFLSTAEGSSRTLGNAVAVAILKAAGVLGV